METTSTSEALAQTVAELADLRRRRLVNRSLLALALAVPLAIFGFFGFKVVRHELATWWLRANQHQVQWAIGPDNQSRGGSTLVKAGVHFNMLEGGDPNKALGYVAWLHQVEALDLSMTFALQDADLAFLARLTDLKSLSLDRSSQGEWGYNQPKLTDEGLISIRHLAHLKNLNLGGNPFTDGVLANLSGLDGLENLDLRFTKITDAGLVRIKALPALKTLDLTGTMVTKEGVDDFEAARPGVRVLADHLPLTAPKPKR